jgi:hypothetical protein
MTAPEHTTRAPGTAEVPAGEGPPRAWPPPDERWEARDRALWASLDEGAGEDAFRARMDALAGELPDGHPVGVFERAAAWDSTGHSDRAVPLYEEALRRGLPGERRRRAVVQMASSLRNLGRAEESVALLAAEREAAHDHLDDAVAAVLALALADVGRAREGVAVAVAALAPHLPRYRRSMADYARALADPGER